jgi:hypothetical protein
MSKENQVKFLKRLFAVLGTEVHVIDMAEKTTDPDEGYIGIYVGHCNDPEQVDKLKNFDPELIVYLEEENGNQEFRLIEYGQTPSFRYLDPPEDYAKDYGSYPSIHQCVLAYFTDKLRESTEDFEMQYMDELYEAAEKNSS